MADQYKTGSIYPIEPNPLLDAASRGTEVVRKFLNREYRHDVPKAELGDILLGQSPEELSKWAYGFHPFNDPKDWARTGPIQEQRQSGVADVLMAPVSDVLGATKLATKGLSSLARGAIEGGTSLGRRQLLTNAGRTTAVPATTDLDSLARESLWNTSGLDRRQFLKNTGKVAAGAAVGIPALIHGLGTDAEKVGAKAVEDAVTKITPHEYHAQRALIDAQARQAGHDALEARGSIAPYHNEEGAKEAYVSTYDAEHKRLLDELHAKVEPHPTERELDVSPTAEAAYIKGHLDQGWLPSGDSWIASKHPHLETIEERLGSGGTYIDPFTGNRAILRSNGEVRWVNGELDWTGKGLDEQRYNHWATTNHQLVAEQKLGLRDDQLRYIGPKSRQHPPQFGRDSRDIDDPPHDEFPEPEDYKRGGAIERTTYVRKIL